MANLTGKRALITGAAQGIGLAIAERFVAVGAQVFLVDIAAESLKSVSDRLGGGHFVADLRTTAQIDAIVAAASDALARPAVMAQSIAAFAGGPGIAPGATPHSTGHATALAALLTPR